MAHRLDKHYSDFGGVDTRSNKLTQNPKSARSGSKNFRWSENDELMNREGFQRKTAQGSACEAGLIEYRFKDINTGEAKSEVLGVAFDGHLRRRVVHFLKLTRTTLSSVNYYSIYYDSANATHKIDFLSSTYTVLGSVNISLTMTLAQLETAIDALALTGLTSSIVDEDDATVAASTALAMNLDWKYREAFNTGATDNKLNGAYVWEQVYSPDGNAPFVNAVNGATDPDWEGISYENLNNAVYITDGGWVYKYDGFSVYRAGMPKTIGSSSGAALSIDGFRLTSTTGGSLTASGVYSYKFQLGFVDPSGATILGKITDPLTITLGGGDSAVNIAVPPIYNGDQSDHFPVYAAKINGNQDPGSGSNSITVDSGHNIKVGMYLRIPISNAPLAVVGYSFMIGTVTAVTSTTITYTQARGGDYPFSGSVLFADNQWIQGGYSSSDWAGKVTDTVSVGTSYFLPEMPFGAFVRVYRTRNGGSTYYRLIDLPLQYPDGTASPGDKYTHLDTLADTGSGSNLSTVAIDDTEGEELPRACKYLSSWQGQLVQAGRPYDSTLKDEFYPTIYNSPTVTGSWGYGTTEFDVYHYGENHLCDFQSVYWADSANAEGFPQSGANEESFENGTNDKVTGLGASKEAIFVFKEETTGYLSGTLATGDIVKEFLEDDTGSACHGAIQKVKGALVFMDEENGFYAVTAGRLPEFIGYPIQDYFTKNNTKTGSEKFNFKRAKSANFKAMNLYLCYIPAGTDTDPSSNSVLFVYDYGVKPDGTPRNCWYVWQGVNAAGGVLATADSELLIASKETSANYLFKLKRTGSVYDHADHLTAVEFNYKGSFLTVGAPVIDKAWIRCVISSVLGGFSLRVDQYANYFDSIVGSLNITFASSNRKNQNLDVKANSDKLKSLSWGFYNNTIFEAVRIDGWEIELADAFDSGEAKK